jgi:hypothetical protein
VNIAEFVSLVALMCSFEAADTSRAAKEDCAIWWTNCAVKESEVVERKQIRLCTSKMNAEKAKGTFPNNPN